MDEIKINQTTGMGLLNEVELRKVLFKTFDYALQGNVVVEFIYNIHLASLSINFRKEGQLEYWFLFQDDKLKQVNLKKLKSSLCSIRTF
jgi:hypothetical protein